MYASMDAFRRVLDDGMTNIVYPKIASRLEAKVEHWEIEVKMLMTKRVDEKGITIKAFPSGKGARLWRFKSFGTRMHTVRVKKLYTMRNWKFKSYKPALALPFKGVRRGFGPAPFQPGTLGFRYNVIVPKRPGVFFEKQVAAEYNKEFRRDTENIVRRAVRAAQREGT